MPFLLKSKPITIEKWKVDRTIITGHRPLFVYLKNNSKYIGEWKNNLKDGICRGLDFKVLKKLSKYIFYRFWDKVPVQWTNL